jgi:hypothetical protein
MVIRPDRHQHLDRSPVDPFTTCGQEAADAAGHRGQEEIVDRNLEVPGKFVQVVKGLTNKRHLPTPANRDVKREGGGDAPRCDDAAERGDVVGNVTTNTHRVTQDTDSVPYKM